MERILKFRGKRFDNGEWVVGSLLSIEDTCFIIEGGDFDFDYRTEAHAFWFDCTEKEVDPDTVSQFTGMLDKNGKEIYEGDIVRYYDDIEDELVSSHVVYHKESCSFCAAPTKLCGDYIGICAHWQFEVIGNIYDNPSLISDKQ